MKKILLALCFLTYALASQAQGPAVTSWLQNTTITGTYYTAGNSTVIPNNILVNCQKVEYSNDFVYVTATGVPAYPTGPQSHHTIGMYLYELPCLRGGSTHVVYDKKHIDFGPFLAHLFICA